MTIKEKFLLGICIALICTGIIHGGLIIQAQEEPMPVPDCKWVLQKEGDLFFYDQCSGNIYSLIEDEEPFQDYYGNDSTRGIDTYRAVPVQDLN